MERFQASFLTKGITILLLSFSSVLWGNEMIPEEFEGKYQVVSGEKECLLDKDWELQVVFGNGNHSLRFQLEANVYTLTIFEEINRGKIVDDRFCGLYNRKKIHHTYIQGRQLIQKKNL